MGCMFGSMNCGGVDNMGEVGGWKYDWLVEEEGAEWIVWCLRMWLRQLCRVVIPMGYWILLVRQLY